MNRLIYLVLLSTLLFSCNQKQKLSEILGSDCLWDVTGDKRVIGGLNSAYLFTSEGNCFFYMYNFYNKQRTDSVFRYDYDDVIVSNTWSAHGDSILIANGARFKVLVFDKDSIEIINNSDTMVLKRNCRTLFKKPKS